MKWTAAALVLASFTAAAIEVQFVSQHPSATLKVEWLGPNDATVDMGAIEPLQTLALKDVGEGHAFVVTSSHTGVAKTFYARANSDNYFLLPSALFNPRLAAETATVRVVCTMQRPTAEEVRIDVYPEWSPRGATRFLELVREGVFDGIALTRVVPRFLTQFGIPASADHRAQWRSANIPDDLPSPSAPPFAPGMMSYAGSGPNSRSTEMFFVMPGTPPHQLAAFGSNPWETPFARLADEASLATLGSFYSYGDMPPYGQGVEPQEVYRQGYGYLAERFPKLDYFETCRVVDGDLEGEEEL